MALRQPPTCTASTVGPKFIERASGRAILDVEFRTLVKFAAAPRRVNGLQLHEAENRCSARRFGCRPEAASEGATDRKEGEADAAQEQRDADDRAEDRSRSAM